MKLSEIRKILPEKDKFYVDVICAPEGIIETQEQYDYVIMYGNNTSISIKDDDKLSDFETAKGYYLGIGDYFGGASFYFYLNEKGKYSYESNNYELVPFTYGKYGKIDFNITTSSKKR